MNALIATGGRGLAQDLTLLGRHSVPSPGGREYRSQSGRSRNVRPRSSRHERGVRSCDVASLDRRGYGARHQGSLGPDCEQPAAHAVAFVSAALVQVFFVVPHAVRAAAVWDVAQPIAAIRQVARAVESSMESQRLERDVKALTVASWTCCMQLECALPHVVRSATRALSHACEQLDCPPTAPGSTAVASASGFVVAGSGAGVAVVKSDCPNALSARQLASAIRSTNLMIHLRDPSTDPIHTVARLRARYKVPMPCCPVETQMQPSASCGFFRLHPSQDPQVPATVTAQPYRKRTTRGSTTLEPPGRRTSMLPTVEPRA